VLNTSCITVVELPGTLSGNAQTKKSPHEGVSESTRYSSGQSRRSFLHPDEDTVAYHKHRISTELRDRHGFAGMLLIEIGLGLLPFCRPCVRKGGFPHLPRAHNGRHRIALYPANYHLDFSIT